MKTKITFALLILALLFNIAASQATPPPRVTWEYKVENGVSEGKINSLSAEGWEVVTSGNYNGGMPFVILRRSK